MLKRGIQVIGHSDRQRDQPNPEGGSRSLHVAELGRIIWIVGSTPTLFALGTISTASANCLLGMSSTVIRMPVTLPPGRAWLAATPNPTGSMRVSETIGIVSVNFLVAIRPAIVPDTMTSG